MKVLGEQLCAVDRAIGRLTAKRLTILDEIAKLDAEDGASERQTASRIARLSASTPKQAAGEIAMAKQVSAFPKLAEAHANGDISNSQLGAVAAIASASSESEAIAFAKTATSSQLHQRASASRGKLFEERRKAHADRYLGFKPEEGGQSVRIHGRLPFAESQQLELQLRKIADRLNLCDKERPSPSARMADALLILTKANASQALHDHLHADQSEPDRRQGTGTSTSSPTGTPSAAKSESTARPKLQTVSTTPNSTSDGQSPVASKSTIGSKPQAVRTGLDSSSSTSDGETPAALNSMMESNQQAARNGSNPSSSTTGSPSTSAADSMDEPKLWSVPSRSSRAVNPVIDYDEDPFPEIASDSDRDNRFAQDHDDVDREGTESERTDSGSSKSSESPTVVVQRADTRLIIHWNAQTGSINFENGPPIDHPRLQAILCDARIDIQHCDANGLPTGLITTAHHSDWRQDRYLAFRDGPCRIPECQGIGKTQAHHIFEDRVDRTTSVQHMINLCNRCHQIHHDGIFTITGDPEQTITFTYKDGTTLTSNARPLPITLKTPKPTPFAKHQPPGEDLDLFAA
jgi:Domain of unknown function (DUF222)